MALTGFDYIATADWCRAVSDGAALLAGPRTRLELAPARADVVPPPAWTQGGDDPAAVHDSADYDLTHGFHFHQGRLAADATWIAHLDDVTCRPVNPTGFADYHLFVTSRLALAESWYHPVRADDLARRFGGALATSLPDGGPHLIKITAADPVAAVENRPAVWIVGPWPENFYHWQIDMLPRLGLIEAIDPAGLGDWVLPLPVDRLQPFHRESLDRLGLWPRVVPIPAAGIRYRRLILPSFPAPGGLSRAPVDWLRARLAAPPDRPPWRRLFLSRRAVGRRRLLNEDALIAALTPLGFETVVPDDVSWAAQCRLFAETAVLVMLHGAACAHFPMMAPGGTVIELAPAPERHPACFYLAGLSGHRYGRILCPTATADLDMIAPIDAVAGMAASACGDPPAGMA